MKILIACEESQTVCSAFRAKGHEAYSCDIQPCSGGHPEWHICCDVLRLLNGRCSFFTADGELHCLSERWDMIVGFPPCTDLCASGARHFAKKRASGIQRESLEFFCKILSADCEKIVVENPVGIVSGDYCKQYYPDLCDKYGLPLKPSCIIHPYMFGDEWSKTTCLWCKGVAPLVPDCVVSPGEFLTTGKDKKRYASWLAWVRDENGKILSWNDPRTALLRSKTAPGIARAMAEQWG